MKYGFDLDDTLTNTASVINKYAKRFDIEYLKGDGKFKIKKGYSRDYYYFADALHWKKNDIRKFFEVYYEEILKEVRIKSGVSDFLKYLKENENDIFILTARREKENGKIKKITEEWLNKRKIAYDKLFVGVKNKYELINQYNIEVFVDDSYENCKSAIELTNAKIYMLKNVYNKKIEDEYIVKIKRIEDILSK